MATTTISYLFAHFVSQNHSHSPKLITFTSRSISTAASPPSVSSHSLSDSYIQHSRIPRSVTFIVLSGGGGDGPPSSSGGGGGGGGGSGTEDNNKEAILALTEIRKAKGSLPTDLAAAIEIGESGSIVKRYFELDKSGRMQFRGFKERLRRYGRG